MNALKSAGATVLGLLASASVVQSLSTAVAAVLVLVPGVHVLSGAQVLGPLLAISGLAQTVEAQLAKRKLATK